MPYARPRVHAREYILLCMSPLDFFFLFFFVVMAAFRKEDVTQAHLSIVQFLSRRWDHIGAGGCWEYRENGSFIHNVDATNMQPNITISHFLILALHSDKLGWPCRLFAGLGVSC